jgi:CheY-like chemotaxis protein
MTDTNTHARILAIEPDPRTGIVLQRILDKRALRADLKVVRTIEAALGSIAGHVPDLILTSTFLPPADLARLTDELRRRHDATHTQIISTPHALEEPEGPFYDDSGRVLRFPRPRSPRGAFYCDPVVLRHQVDEYLEQARALRAAAADRLHRGVVPVTDLVLAVRPPSPWQPASGSPALTIPTPQDLRALKSLRPSDRRRASRRRAADLAGQWGLKLGADGEASILDISCSGVRLETSTRLHPGNLIDLEVIGMEGSLAVGARLIRTEAVDADGPDVKYRAAAMFLREIDLFEPNTNPALVAAAAAAAYTPTVLADLLGRVLANATWVTNGAPLRSAFESEVCALVKAREVRIRAVPVRAAGGCQSLYFNIPGAGGPEHGLHVVFERGYRPTAAEFRLLKAAASLASVVIDLAPAAETPSIN